MCRLYGFLANERTKVECTLVHAQNALLHQSQADMKGHTHSDGWGICCYPDGMPHCERRATAAHEDIWFSTTAERTYSHAVVAHVRRATIGRASLENTHPFVYGYWTFAHNGTLANFSKFQQQLLGEVNPQLRRERTGNTDSELIFLWLLSRFDKAGIAINEPDHDTSWLIDVVAKSLRRLEDQSGANPITDTNQLNLMITNGRLLLATRWNHTLHYVKRFGLHDCEVCGIPHVQHDQKNEYRACVIASEPISQEAWEAVANHTILVVDSDVDVHFYPVE